MEFKDKIKFLFDSNDNKVAVQMDIDVYEAIEDYIEDEALLKKMLDAKKDEKDLLELDEAIEYYKKLPEHS